MKTPFFVAATVALAALHGLPVGAAIVSGTDPDPLGIGYRWTVSLGLEDTANIVRRVGAWGWEDQTLVHPSGLPLGWTHNSEWVALTLEAPTYLTIRIANKAGVPDGNVINPGFFGDNLFPGFSLYTGWHNVGDPLEDIGHSYYNRGDIVWASNLSYIGHEAPEGRHVVERTFALPAGQYTLVLGGNSDSLENEGLQGYETTFTTSAVPEPGTAALVLLGALSLGLRRRSPGGSR